jgi:transposase
MRLKSDVPAAHRRHDISDSVWSLLESHLPVRKEGWFGRARENRLFFVVFCILRTGAPWRDLPADNSDWKNTLIGVFVAGVIGGGMGSPL